MTAENHYTNDYPEEEADPDDEDSSYPYAHRYNAADDEEYDATTWDEDRGYLSDDVEDGGFKAELRKHMRSLGR